MKSLKESINESLQVVNEKKSTVYNICTEMTQKGQVKELVDYLEECANKLENIKPAQIKKVLGSAVNVKACKNVIEGYVSEITAVTSILPNYVDEPEEVIEYIDEMFPISNRLDNLVNNNDFVEFGEDENEVLNDITEYWNDICKVVLGEEWY